MVWLGVLCIACVQLAAAVEDHKGKTEALLSCFHNKSPGSCLAQGAQTSWDHLHQDKPSCLNATRVWWSPQPPGLAVTLITQLSADRLQQLRAQCAAWMGPLAAAVYLPIISPLISGSQLVAEAAQQLQATAHAVQEEYDYAEEHKRCQLRIMLIHELFHDAHTAKVLYPVNSLRNWARLMANTPLVRQHMCVSPVTYNTAAHA